MNRIGVKICGINSAPAMDAAVQAGADWIGFVFHAASPRHVTPQQAESLSQRHRGGPLRVGLFVDPAEEDIDDALDAIPLDVLQIYAEPERVAELRALFGLTVWRAVSVAGPADLPRPSEPVDGYVLEGKPPPGATRPGGNGQAFDPALLHNWLAPRPWLLAGGLTAANVAAAIAASTAVAVDVSSGVESEPGVKDPVRIAAFVAAARSATPGGRGEPAVNTSP